jgi:hypothetical protein
MKEKYLFVTLSILLGSSLQAAEFSFTVDAGYLRDNAGNLMPTTGLVMPVAGANSSFAPPTATAFVGGDDVVLWSRTLSLSDPGTLSAFASNLPEEPGYTGGPVLLRWFPSLTLGSTAPGAGTAYGEYRSSAGLDGSASWFVPAAGTTIGYAFSTSDFVVVGSNPAVSARAQCVAGIPEPVSSGLVIAVVMGVFVLYRRRSSGAAAPRSGP